jgi:hypothetical protein|tara:strand:- start:81 stop:278 length:198 start_codon:yes stop_codon:yes gene_type:complete
MKGDIMVKKVSNDPEVRKDTVNKNSVYFKPLPWKYTCEIREMLMDAHFARTGKKFVSSNSKDSSK